MIAVAGDDDAGVLLDVVEALRDRAVGRLRCVLAADRMSEHEPTVLWPPYKRAVAAAHAFEDDLRGAARRRDAGGARRGRHRRRRVRVYHEQAVATGTPREGMRERVGGRRLQDALAALDALGDVSEAIEVSCRLAGPIRGAERVTQMRVELARLDSDSAEMLAVSELDDSTRRELFDSAPRKVLTAWRQAPLLV